MSPKKKTNVTGFGTVFVLLLVITAGFFYSISGTDPLGLFPAENQTQVTESSSSVASQSSSSAGTSSTESSSSVNSPITNQTWWQVYFVSPTRVRQAEEIEYGTKGIPADLMANSIAEKLINKIDNAKTSIHIASFEVDVVDIANALIRAKQRGVEVRWITDDEFGIEADSKEGHGQIAIMKKGGIEFKDDARGGLMHNKFWIFDGQTVWTGSTNVTISGLFEQDNNVIVIESADLAAIYERQFNDMWNGEFGARSPSTVSEQIAFVNGTPIQVLFSPEDDAVFKIIPFIQTAKKSIRFLAFSFTQPDLGNAMIERAKNGVSVSGVFETVGSETQFSELTPLYCAKAAVKQDTNFAFLHHKVIIVDERYVITGSLNFSDNANKSNNENVIIIDNADIARLYTQEFERIFAISADPDPAKMNCP